MKLIVGLGNPGEKYHKTRHNIGFEVIDFLLSKNNAKLNKEKFNGVFYKTDDYILAKPLTFMNLSGDFVQAIAHFYKIKSQDILIIYDDMDHVVGNAILKPKGSAGGQNGMKDIINKIGTQEIYRIKVGIGRGHKNSVKHVLGKFSQNEIEKVQKTFEEIALAVKYFIQDDTNKAMVQLNTK